MAWVTAAICCVTERQFGRFGYLGSSLFHLDFICGMSKEGYLDLERKEKSFRQRSSMESLLSQ